MARVLKGRFTARMDEPFVVFVIGMRVNKFLAFDKWATTHRRGKTTKPLCSFERLTISRSSWAYLAGSQLTADCDDIDPYIMHAWAMGR